MSQAHEEQTDDYLVAFETLEHVQDFSTNEECQERALEKVTNKLEDEGLDHLDVRIGRQSCSADDCAEIHADMVIGAGNGMVRVVVEGRVYNAEDEDHAASAMGKMLSKGLDGTPRMHRRTQLLDDDGQ